MTISDVALLSRPVSTTVAAYGALKANLLKD